MNPGRVGILSTWNTVCGIADFTANFINGLQACGREADVVPIDRAAHRYFSRKELAAEFDALGERLASYDIVHIQHEFGFFMGEYGMYESLDNFRRVLRAAVAARRHIVVTFHTLPPLRGLRQGMASAGQEAVLRALWRGRVVRELQKGNVQAISHTRFLRRSLIDTGIPARLIRVVPHGSPPPVEEADAQTAKAALGYSKSDRILIIVGFVSNYKGHRYAVEALRYLPDNYCLAVVGGPHPNGNEQTFDSVLRKTLRPQLAKRVRVTDYLPISEVRAYLAAADIALAPYVLPDLASSGAIAWALASGRPVVASRIPAFEELNEGAPRVFLATPAAPVELARRIIQLDQDEAMKAELTKNALSYIEETSWPRVARQYLDIYGMR
jgi:glycosyltransferase involved in cell wall biosynthesis